MKRLAMRTRLVCSTLVAVAVTGTLAGQARPLRVEDVLAVQQFADREQLAVSPDSRLVAYALVDPGRASALAEADHSNRFSPSGVPVSDRGADVFLTDYRSGTTRNLTGAQGSSWGPVWSPDGRRLAFYSDRDGAARLWLWDREHNTLRRCSEAVVHHFFGFEEVRWSPDGRRILLKLRPIGISLARARWLAGDTTGGLSTPGARDALTARVFTTARDTAHGQSVQSIDSSPSFFNAALADLALVDVATCRVKRIVERVRPMAYRFSPDGARIAFTTRQPDDGKGSVVWGLYDLSVVDTSGRDRRLLVPRVAQEYGLSFSWSPDGQRVAYTADGDLETIDLSSGDAPRRVARPGLRLDESFRAPLWLGDTAVIMLAADTLWRVSVTRGKVDSVGSIPDRQLLEIVAPAEAQRHGDARVVVATRDPVTLKMGFGQIELHSGAARALYEGDVALGGTDLAYNLAPTLDGGIVFVAETSDHPAEVWTADSGLAHPHRLTSNNAGLASRAFGRSQLISWHGPTGEALHGALLLPSDHEEGKRYPLIVKVYGGSYLSRAVNRFGLEGFPINNLQLLATRGYAVLLPDAPLREGTPLADLAATVLPGVDAAVALGIADSNRLGLMGHSYGGYSTLALLVQTSRFRAAVSSGGFSNLFSKYAEVRDDGSPIGVEWAEHGQGRMGVPPWQGRDRYFVNSPFFALDRVTTPILLLHGGADETVFPERARETFMGLRRLGKTATLVVYMGEGHSPETWGLANAKDYWARIFEWFDNYLKR